MHLLRIVEKKLSSRTIILFPAILGFSVFVLFLILFPEQTGIGEILSVVGIFLGGCSGLLMIHYKKVPGIEDNPKMALIIGAITTLVCWVSVAHYLFVLCND